MKPLSLAAWAADFDNIKPSEYLTDQAPEVMAKKRGGLNVIRPQSNELFIDIDDKYSLARFYAAWPLISEEFPGSFIMHPSPSGEPHKQHIIVTLTKDVDTLTRLALQAILGSDPKREALGILRMLRGTGDESVLYRRPETARYVVAFTEYVRPNGRKRQRTVSVSSDIAPLAAALVNVGCYFDIEELRTGAISLTCERQVAEHEVLAHEIRQSWADVFNATEVLVIKAHERLRP